MGDATHGSETVEDDRASDTGMPWAVNGSLAAMKEGLANAVGGETQTWTFSSSGWLFVYFFGCIRALRDLERHRDVYVVGSSGGACAGSFLFLKDSDACDQVVEYVKRCAVKARSGSIKDALNIRGYVQGAIRAFMTPDTPAAVQGNLEISVSRLQNPFTNWPPWPLKNVRIKQFGSPAELENAILASACVVPFPPVHIEGLGYCIDGVYSDAQLISSIILGRPFFQLHRIDAAISVSPFYSSRADIVPSQFVNPLWAAYPPEPEKLDWLYRLAYKDCLAWLCAEGKIPYGIPQEREPSAEAAPGAELHQNSALIKERLQDAWSSIQKTGYRYLKSMQQGSKTYTANAGFYASDALSCSEAASQGASEAASALRKLVSYVCWCLIVMEMVAQSCFAAVVASWSIVLPMSTATAFKRFQKTAKAAASPRLLWKTIPKISPHIDLDAPANRDFARMLREHSVLFRVLLHLLY